MGRVLLTCRLAARDLRHRPAQAVLLLLAITAATATLTLGLALNGVTASPYLRTRAATNGPDVTASVYPGGPDGTQPANTAPLTALLAVPGVTASSGPFPVASAMLRARGYAVPVQAEGRDEAPAAVDQPALTQGTWVRPGGVVLERTFAQALGVTIGDRVTLNGRPFVVAGIAVTAAIPEYPGVCYYLTCNADAQAEESGMGLVWVTQPAALSLATAAMPVSYVLNLKLGNPAAAPAFAAAHGPVTPGGAQTSSPVEVLTWQQIQYADDDLVSVAQQVLTPGGWLAVALAVASVAVLAGGRMTEQARRVGQLKAAGGTPAMVGAVLLAEHVFLALVAAAAGLGVGWLIAPLLTNAGAGLIGAPGAPALTGGTIGLVAAVALGVTLAATLVPAVRAARTSTVGALANSARPPSRGALLIAVSARLPVPLLIGLRLIARRPRRALLGAASTAVTVTGIVAVMAAHHAGDVAARRNDWFTGLSDPVTGRVGQVMAVLTVVLVTLAAVNAIVIAWATALDARQPTALARALGGTPRQVTAGLAAAQVLPVLPGAL
ncbi:FtsX-like permease family protein, partial [Trebonia sp.]|uniref:FtsX-like permease family protein n=1 Tax=Trebonia sp. TaxID=2767075 RepID=UPI002631984F